MGLLVKIVNSAVSYFCNTFHLRCFTGFWMHFWENVFWDLKKQLLMENEEITGNSCLKTRYKKILTAEPFQQYYEPTAQPLLKYNLFMIIFKWILANFPGHLHKKLFNHESKNNGGLYSTKYHISNFFFFIDIVAKLAKIWRVWVHKK